MSRFNKYRVWDVDGKEMLSVFRIDFNPETGQPHTVICGVAEDGCMASKSLWNATEEIFKPSFVLMQSTGLKDKNGKEIYDGDIVSHDAFVNSEVNYRDGCFWFYDYSWIEYGANYPSEWEVLGNIHQHPHLLP